MRKVHELDEAVASIKRLLSSGGSQLVYDGRFLKALQRLEEAEADGPAAGRTVVRSVAVISKMLCDEFLKDNKPDGQR